MPFENILLVSIIWLIIFLCGYSMGRRVGNREGINEGLKLSKLELRHQLLSSSICPLCDKKLNEQTNCDNVHIRD